MKLAALAAGLAATAAFAGAQGGISVIVDGNPVVFHGVGPQQVNGRVLVPLRGVLEKMGAYVDWQSAGQLITAQRGDTTINLRIGERSAQVNNRTVNLDVPAEIYRGSTMVPLRFMSEALGADVRWEPSQYAVLISTGSGVRDQPIGNPPPPYNPPPVEPAHIQSFSTDSQGRVAAGDLVTFTLRGTPGGDATLTIPGLDGSIPMDEIANGVYEARWTVPNSQSGFNLTRITPVARLRVGNTESSFQMTQRVRQDNTPPRIDAVNPPDQATITVSRPTISATFAGGVGNDVDPQSVRLTVDGQDVSQDMNITSSGISYRPAVGFGPGRHNVVLRARDISGNPVTKSWMFRVGQQTGDVIQSFNAPDVSRARPGDVLRFVLLAQPSGQAHFSIGDVLTRKPMDEVSPGRYVGTYTVRRGDALVDQPMTAEFIARNGAVYNVNSTDNFSVDGGVLAAPTIDLPRKDEPITNPVVVQGRAEPGSRVDVRVEYSLGLAGVASMTGTVSHVTVVADDRGRYRTDPISLDNFMRGRTTRYTVTVSELGPHGQKSDPISITVGS